MQTESIQAFVTVCDRGSFQAAADALYLTQPAVSKRLANLESRLGHTLFDRVGRGVALTEAGRAYLPHARELLAVMADGSRALDSLGERVGGTLSLALSHHVSLHRMPGVLRRFIYRYPQVVPEIYFVDSEAACRLVANGECELAVITLPATPHPVLEQRVVWPDPMQVFVGRDHALADRSTLDVVSLTRHAAILPPSNSTTRQIIDSALDARGITIDARMESHYLETLRMLAGVGLGWTVLPSAMAHPELCRLPFNDLAMTRDLGAVVHPRRSLSNASRALLELLDEARRASSCYR